MSSVSDKNFQALQHQFASHIRNPEVPLIDGIEDRRMKIYRDLFFKNIEGFTSATFPVAKSIMPAAWWQDAVRDFMVSYRCKSPYFNTISKDFLEFITHVRQPTGEEPGFLSELMHYEWVELALETDPADPFTEEDHYSNDLLNGCPVKSPLAWPLNYRYPVHQISIDFQPEEPPKQPCWLMVYRNRNDKVQFMLLNALTARLLQLFEQHKNLTGQQALEQLTHETGQNLLVAGREILQQLHAANIILGAR